MTSNLFPRTERACIAEILVNGAVVIATITISMQLRKIDFVEDKTGNAMRLRSQNVESLGDAGTRGLSPLDNNQNFVGDGRECKRINGHQQRRGIHHNVVELDLQSSDEIMHPLRH